MRLEKWAQSRATPEGTDGSGCHDSGARGCCKDCIVSVSVKYGTDVNPTRHGKKLGGGGNKRRFRTEQEAGKNIALIHIVPDF